MVGGGSMNIIGFFWHHIKKMTPFTEDWICMAEKCQWRDRNVKIMLRAVYSEVLCKYAASVGKKREKITLLLMTVDQRLALTKKIFKKLKLLKDLTSPTSSRLCFIVISAVQFVVCVFSSLIPLKIWDLSDGSHSSNGELGARTRTYHLCESLVMCIWH